MAASDVRLLFCTRSGCRRIWQTRSGELTRRRRQPRLRRRRPPLPRQMARRCGPMAAAVARGGGRQRMWTVTTSMIRNRAGASALGVELWAAKACRAEGWKTCEVFCVEDARFASALRSNVSVSGTQYLCRSGNICGRHTA